MAEHVGDSPPGVREIMRELPEVRGFYEALVAAAAIDGEGVGDAFVHLRGLAELREMVRGVPEVRELYDAFLRGVALYTTRGRPHLMDPALGSIDCLLGLAQQPADGAVQEAALCVIRGLAARPRPSASKHHPRRTREEFFSLLVDVIVYVLINQGSLPPS